MQEFPFCCRYNDSIRHNTMSKRSGSYSYPFQKQLQSRKKYDFKQTKGDKYDS